MTDWIKQAADAAAAQAPVPGDILPRVPGRVVHIDGDYVAYYCAGNDECDPGRARQNVLERVETAMVMSGATRAMVHLTAGGSHKGHRYNVATVKPYQAQRSGSRKPKNWQYLRHFLEGYTGDAFKVKLWTEREADDGIAAYAYETLRRGKPLAAIHTADKDMRMLPGIHLNWKTFQLTEVMLGQYDVIGPDELQYGLKWFFLQLLQGDTADNIPGLPRFAGKLMGPKTAEKALVGINHVAASNVVPLMYQDHYPDDWADRLAEQAALLWLRTDMAASLTDWFTAFTYSDFVGELAGARSRLEQRVNDELAELARITALGDQCND